MEQEIKDYSIYNSSMKKSMKDKLFFTDKVFGVTEVVDFGCADGALLGELQKEDFCAIYIGYDNNDEMINIARKNHSNCIFTNTFSGIHESDNSRRLLNLSSVIHEVYSYSTSQEIENFWENVFNSGFKYIAIRDFCVSKSINRAADINDYAKLLKSSSNYGDSWKIKDFENTWGTLKENKNLVHYLLKYRYEQNWNREVRENYFPITYESLLSIIPTSNYRISYHNEYILPYTYNQIKDDFNIEIKDNTHIQLLLEKI